MNINEVYILKNNKSYDVDIYILVVEINNNHVKYVTALSLDQLSSTRRPKALTLKSTFLKCFKFSPEHTNEYAIKSIIE